MLSTLTELNNVEFRFRNENGNTFYLNDHDDDGIATGQFGEWSQEGTYTLDYIRLSDRANSSNQITYYNDGTTRFWDGQNNSDVFGEHEFDFSGYSLVFDKQLPPQTDWTPPELISLGELNETEVTPNQKFNMSYSAFDADSEINNVEFRFRNENGNTFYLNDQDDDGIATGQLSEWSQEGTYTLDYIRLSDRNDSNNTISYKASGRTEYYDRDYESNLNGQHSFDFSDISFTFTKQQEVQTDWTPPELTSLGELSENEVTYNQKFYINYNAFDTDSELNNVEFRFRNENGKHVLPQRSG